MRALKHLALLVVALLLMAATPWTYDVYGPGGNYGKPRPPLISRPGLPGQPVRRFAENWQEILCLFVAYSVSPTLPPATQKLYLGNCPDRSYYQAGVAPLPVLQGRLR